MRSELNSILKFQLFFRKLSHVFPRYMIERKTKQVLVSFFSSLNWAGNKSRKHFLSHLHLRALFKARSLSTQAHTKLAHEARFHLRTSCFAISWVQLKKPKNENHPQSDRTTPASPRPYSSTVTILLLFVFYF